MFKCKYDTVEYALTLIILPDTLVIYLGIPLALFALIANGFDLSVFPWWLYIVIGGSLLITHLIYLIIYLCVRKTCQYDDNDIILINGEKVEKISKSQIKNIIYSKASIFIAALAYETYGSVVILCNEQKEYKIFRFKVFPRVISRLKELGYPIEYS